MRLSIATALMLAAACGGSVAPEPFVYPAGSVDLNATPITLKVYGTAQFIQRGFAVTELHVVASMSGSDAFAPTVKLPSDPTRPLVVGALDAPIQEENSLQPTATVVLRGYPQGKLDLQVHAFAGKDNEVGVACLRSEPIDGIPSAGKSNLLTTVKVVLSSVVKPCP